MTGTQSCLISRIVKSAWHSIELSIPVNKWQAWNSQLTKWKSYRQSKTSFWCLTKTTKQTKKRFSNKVSLKCSLNNVRSTWQIWCVCSQRSLKSQTSTSMAKVSSSRYKSRSEMAVLCRCTQSCHLIWIRCHRLVTATWGRGLSEQEVT